MSAQRERDAEATTARIRRGFSLLEIIVAMAVLVVLVAAMAPSLLSAIQKAKVENTAESLDAIVQAMAEFNDDTKEYPGYLSHLSRPITNSDYNSCRETLGSPQNQYTTGHAGQWDGPYVDRLLPTTGFPVPIGHVQDAIIRQDLGTPAVDALLKIVVNTVQEEDAIELNTLVDGDYDAGGGTVQYTAPNAEGFVTLYYVMPGRGC